jgi:hypothetical protein
MLYPNRRLQVLQGNKNTQDERIIEFQSHLQIIESQKKKKIIIELEFGIARTSGISASETSGP